VSSTPGYRPTAWRDCCARSTGPGHEASVTLVHVGLADEQQRQRHRAKKKELGLQAKLLHASARANPRKSIRANHPRNPSVLIHPRKSIRENPSAKIHPRKSIRENPSAKIR
jgi:hypothetical protein